MRVLVVDDDPKLRDYVQEGLRSSSIECAAAESGEHALELLRGDPKSFDLILLDVMLPAKSGWELLMDLREQGRETPVIFVTARDTVEERVRGLKLGADDYVIKPFAFSELLARIEVVIRRRRMLPPIEARDMRLDLAKRVAYRGEHKVDLSPREFDLLLALVRADGKTLTRSDLLRDVWGFEREPETNLVDVHIGRLRRKLDRHGPPLIDTVRGSGYRIPVER
jgi:two-component system copper resistance phosphate regulon response regulator CusR